MTKTYRAVKRMTCHECNKPIEPDQPYRYEQLKSGAVAAVHNPRCPK